MTNNKYVPNEKFPLLDNMNVRMELLGFPNLLSSFTQFNSAPRIGMFNHHTAQTMVIDKPEFNKIFTGVEEKFIDYTFNYSRREFNCDILAVIPKYHAPLVTKQLIPSFYVLVLTHEPNGVRHLDYFVVNRYFSETNGFGWIPEIDNIHQIIEGEYLSKDTIITHSPAVQGNEYRRGINLNVCYGSFPETIEDAFIISQSAAEKMQTQQISRKVINCRMDRRLLNIYGDRHEDKFLPDIGSYVRSDGILMAQRSVRRSTVLADTDPEALREPLLQDEIIYAEAGAKILDLTFDVNRNKWSSVPRQAKLYNQNNLKFWEDIYSVYTKHKKQYPLTNKMNTLVRDAIYHMIAQGTHNSYITEQYRKAMKKFEIEGVNGQTIDFVQVEVVYGLPRPVSNGTKITDAHGAKGVIGAIYPDEWMPVDEQGIRADLLIDMNSPVGRNNPGQLYETGINRISEFVRREVDRVYKVQGVNAAHDVLMDYYNDVNPNYAELIKKNDVTTASRKETVEDAIEFSPRIWIPPFLDKLTPSDEDFWNAITNFKRWADKWKAEPSCITFTTMQADGTGKQFTSEVPFAIGSKYIYQLHKIPEIFAPGPASVNHIGIPVKAAFETKNYPVSNNPLRFGEDELRMTALDSDVREVTRLLSLQSNSPAGVKESIRSILLSEHPTAIKRMSISNGNLYQTNAVQALFHNTAAVLGIESRNTKNDELTGKLTEILNESNELNNAIWDVEVVDDRDSTVKTDKVISANAARRSAQKSDKLQKMIDSIISEDIVAVEDDAMTDITGFGDMEPISDDNDIIVDNDLIDRDLAEDESDGDDELEEVDDS